MTETASFMPSSRNATADLLKGVAVVLMIQVHLFEQFATLELFHSRAGLVSLFLGGPPAAPVFLAVMGYFIALSRKTPSRHVGRGVLLILGGLLLNLGLNANLLYSIHRGRFDLDPLAFIFGADILPLAGLSCIIIALLRPLFKQSAVAFAALACVVVAITPMLPPLSDVHPALCYTGAFFGGDMWWSYFPLLPWFAYPLLGVAFAYAQRPRTMFAEAKPRTQLYLSATVGVLLAAGLPNAAAVVTDLPHYYHHSGLLALWITGFLLFWLLLLSFLERRVGSSSAFRYLKWLGRYVTAAYVFQWLIIGNVATEIYRTQTGPQLVFWFIAVLGGTSLLVHLFNITKNSLLLRRVPAS